MKALYIIVAALCVCVGVLAWHVHQLRYVVNHYEHELAMSAVAVRYAIDRR